MTAKNNLRTHLIYLLFKVFFPRMCFPSNYTKTSIKRLIRPGNSSGAIWKVQLLECKRQLQNHQVITISCGVEAKIAAIGIWNHYLVTCCVDSGVQFLQQE